MPSLRWSGGTNRPAAGVAHHAVADHDAPVSLRSSPATMRSVVVLPQPEGPSRVTNSPCSTARSTRVDRLQRAEVPPDSRERDARHRPYL